MPDNNEELLRYYSDRKVWVFQPDLKPPKVVPYEMSTRGMSIR